MPTFYQTPPVKQDADQHVQQDLSCCQHLQDKSRITFPNVEQDADPIAPKPISLSDLPNIGTTLAQRLSEIGISTPEELIRLGSKTAFIRLKVADPTTCINTLMALEGAVLGIRWHHLSEDSKLELKQFYRQEDA
jgi:DNA transformation protein